MRKVAGVGEDYMVPVCHYDGHYSHLAEMVMA